VVAVIGLQHITNKLKQIAENKVSILQEQWWWL